MWKCSKNKSAAVSFQSSVGKIIDKELLKDLFYWQNFLKMTQTKI